MRTVTRYEIRSFTGSEYSNNLEADADPSGSRQEPVVMPLRMTEKELDGRVRDGIKQQPKHSANSNFHLRGWDAAKVFPTVKAMVLSIGLVELIDDEA